MNDTALSQTRTAGAPPPAIPTYQAVHFRLAVPDERPRQILPRNARDLVAVRLRLWQLGHLVDDARLVTSELVTNAVQHALQGVVGLSVRLSPGLLRIEVRDSASGIPEPRRAGVHDECGRGLHLVRQLCDAWGYDRLAWGAKTTWCTFRTVAS